MPIYQQPQALLGGGATVTFHNACGVTGLGTDVGTVHLGAHSEAWVREGMEELWPVIVGYIHSYP